jgi:hypothetical protein
LENNVRYILIRDWTEAAADPVVEERKAIFCDAWKVTVIPHWRSPQLICYIDCAKSANLLSPAGIQPIYVV